MKLKRMAFSDALVPLVVSGRKTMTRRGLGSKWKVGDLFVVSEAWGRLPDGTIIYRADAPDAPLDAFGWRPPMFQLVADCRPGVYLVTAVRVEPLWSITPEDALREGILCPEIGYANWGERAPVLMFRRLWNSIHGACAWERNEMVRAITFRKESEGE
jgi:hypothetical protein